VDPVPDQLLLEKSGGAGNGTQTSKSIARNPDHLTTEAVMNIRGRCKKCFWGVERRLERKAESFAAMYQPTVYRKFDPEHLKPL
jgi:hypothetical protein